MSTFKRKKNKEELAEEVLWTEFWAGQWDESIPIECSEFQGKPILKPGGQSGLRCPHCTQGFLVFLQGTLIPQSQYNLWCPSCSGATNIKHENYWQYLEPIVGDLVVFEEPPKTEDEDEEELNDKTA